MTVDLSPDLPQIWSFYLYTSTGGSLADQLGEFSGFCHVNHDGQLFETEQKFFIDRLLYKENFFLEYVFLKSFRQELRREKGGSKVLVFFFVA